MSVHPYLQSTGPLAIAHRGGARETTENTREAFAYARELGFRYLETDAQLTSDGIVVAFHDDEVDRVSSECGAIRAMSWEQLQVLPLIGGGTLISVEEMLADFPDTYFNIDAKSDAVVEPLLTAVAKLDAFDRVCIGSFSDERLVRVRSAHPGIVCTSFGPRGTFRCVVGSLGLPVEPPLANALQLPPSYRGIPLLTKRLIDYAHDLGIAVHAWTIDEPDEMERLLDLGIDGIMTDRPSVLKAVFSSRGLSI